MSNERSVFALALFLSLAFPNISEANAVDPQLFIKENGYDSQRLGDNGKTNIYSKHQTVGIRKLRSLQADIMALPKNPDVFKACDFMRGLVKPRLIEQYKVDLDVVVSNYGHEGSIIACHLKYMHSNNVGNQLIYTKNTSSGLYMLFIGE